MTEPEKRPWWVPLLGVGSIGLGGFQALGALLMAYGAAEVGGKPGGVFFGLAAAWFVPGILLGASGVGIVAGTRWGRGLSFAAFGAMALSLGIVTAYRGETPEAVLGLIEYGEKQPEVAPWVKRARSSAGGDPFAALRDPDQAAISAWMYTLYCGCGMPWYLLVLGVCALPAGRRIATPTPPGASRTAAP